MARFSLEFRVARPLQSVRAPAMRRFPLIRFVTMLAILLVASSVSARATGAAECECCGPVVGAPAAPVAPCCIGAADRRVALFTQPRGLSTPLPEVVDAPFAAIVDARGGSDAAESPPGLLRPQYLRPAVLRI